jgi:hypothetical protein
MEREGTPLGRERAAKCKGMAATYTTTPHNSPHSKLGWVEDCHLTKLDELICGCATSLKEGAPLLGTC